MSRWGNQCGYGKIGGSRERATSLQDILASMERELADRRANYGDGYCLTQEQIELIAEFKKMHPELEG